MEYGETFAKKSYFQNYFFYDFYADPQVLALVEYDFLFLRIASCIFGQSGHCFRNLIYELYEEEKEENSKTDRLDSNEFLKKWITFIALISETIASNKTDIAFANIIELED